MLERKVQHPVSQRRPGFRIADDTGKQQKTARYHNDQQFRRLLNRSIHAFRAEQDKGHTGKGNGRPDPRLPPAMRADQERFERAAAGPRPAGENPAEDVEKDEYPGKVARDAAESGVDTFSRRQRVATNLAINPELKKDTQQRRPGSCRHQIARYSAARQSAHPHRSRSRRGQPRAWRASRSRAPLEEGPRL